MKGKRALAAVLLSALLLLCGSTLGASAETIVIYQTAVNEQFIPLTTDTMPVSLGGVIYVPCAVFDRNVTRVNLGVYYGLDRRDGRYTVTLYSTNKLLTFDMNRGTCEDGAGEEQSIRAIIRNGTVYVPIARVCQFFGDGLTWSLNETEYGTLVRICSRDVVLDDRSFMTAANSLMMGRYNNFIRSIIQSAATPTPSPAPTPTPTPQPGEVVRPRVYLAVRCTGAGELDRILDALDGARARALFLFAPDDLEEHAPQIRRILGTGHALGLITEAADPAAALEELERGSGLLAKLAHARAHTAWAPRLDGAARGELRKAGWMCWQTNIDGTTGRRSASGLYQSVLQAIGGRRSPSRAAVLLEDDAAGAGALERLLPTLRREGYEVRLAVETVL